MAMTGGLEAFIGDLRRRMVAAGVTTPQRAREQENEGRNVAADWEAFLADLPGFGRDKDDGKDNK